jgi:ERCC4-type nuclease
MKIILDIREHALFEQLGQQVEKQPLDIGDVLLQDDEGKNIIIMERKTIADLLASIKDGRYEEQSHRLMHSTHIHNHHIFYILEGNLQILDPYEKKLVYSALTSLSIFKGFSVVRTMNIMETASLILAFHDKITRNMEKGKLPFYWSEPTSHPTEIKSYSELVKTVKKDNITPENMGEILLCQIPGISSVTAKAIMKRFDGSFLKMCQELESNEEPNTLFKDIVLEKDGKIRKINKTCGENIIKFLCNTPFHISNADP